MKRIMCILAILAMVSMAAIAEQPVLKVSGNTDTYVYHDDAAAGAFDFDSNVLLSYWNVSLALNAGYTLTFPDTSVVSWGYALKYAQAFGPIAAHASLASDSMSYTINGIYAGNLLDDIVVGLDFTKAPFGFYADALFSAVEGYDFFQAFELSAAYLPKWGYIRAGLDVLDAQAVTDDVGYINAPAALEGFSFFLKAGVTY